MLDERLSSINAATDAVGNEMGGKFMHLWGHGKNAMFTVFSFTIWHLLLVKRSRGPIRGPESFQTLKG